MKRLNFYLLAFTLTTLTAQADYVPGRVRVDAKGDLPATATSGIFDGIDRAIVLQEVTDGVGVTGYLLLAPKGELHFKVSATRNSRCGPVYTAKSDSEKGYTLSLRDSEMATKCRLPSDWTVDIRKGSNSRIVLEGAPRRYLLPQDGEGQQ